MSGRFKAPTAVMLLLFREGEEGREILLQLRQNTGYADGMWDCAATGHVDEGESIRSAMAREAWEEVGILINPASLSYATMNHKFTAQTGDIYTNIYFVAERYEGTPSIKEPEKCGDLRWFPLERLPGDIIPDRRIAIENYRRGVLYDEIGWESRPPQK